MCSLLRMWQSALFLAVQEPGDQEASPGPISLVYLKPCQRWAGAETETEYPPPDRQLHYLLLATSL
jgi:hypothetical protein